MTERIDIRAKRLNAGKTQRDIAAECQVSLTTVQRLEAGMGANPANAKKVADYFDLQVTDLMPIEKEAA